MSDFSTPAPQTTDEKSVLWRKFADSAYTWAVNAGATGTTEPLISDPLTMVIRKTSVNLYRRALI